MKSASVYRQARKNEISIAGNAHEHLNGDETVVELGLKRPNGAHINSTEIDKSSEDELKSCISPSKRQKILQIY